MNQPNGLSHSNGVVAHPKLSHLLSQWVSWAQGVWDAAVCWGRGKLCENCVGEAKKNITAWQQRCRECRMRRRSGGARGGDGREEGGSVSCVWISNKAMSLGVWWGSYSSHAVGGAVWRSCLEEREGMDGIKKESRKRKRRGGSTVAMDIVKDGWGGGVRDGQHDSSHQCHAPGVVGLVHTSSTTKG